MCLCQCRYPAKQWTSHTLKCIFLQHHLQSWKVFGIWSKKLKVCQFIFYDLESVSVFPCRIPEASTSSRSTPMGAPPSVTIVGRCSMGSCTRGWNVTVSGVFLLLSFPSGCSRTGVEELDNSFLLHFSGKYHFKWQLFIVQIYFEWIFQYCNNLLMKITSSAENMVYSAWCGWRAFVMAILVCLGEYTLKDWNFSSVCSQGLVFSLCLICL